MRSLLVVTLLVVLVVLVSCSSAAAAPTEAELKKMKVRELRQFLDDRGLACNDCQEKSDFVRFALKNGNVPVVSGKVKEPVPEGAFWDVWSGIAKNMCEEWATKGSIEEKDKICNAVSVATDSLFMQHGKRTAQKLKKKPDALKKTSWGEPYQQAGRKMFNNLFAFCQATKNRKTCSSSSKIQPLMEDKKKVKGVDFIMYLTNVGIENTNPMYEILKAKTPTHDEL